MTASLAPLPVGSIGRVAFLGTPDTSARVLADLLGAGVDVAHVITRADKKRGRGSTLVPSPVKKVATDHGVPVSHRVDDLLELDPPVDLGVVVAYGALVKEHVLARIPMVNLHFSLLPRWRGAAPIERCIMAGDLETGVCLMHVEVGLDTGGVLACERVAIDESVTADELRDELSRIGGRLLVAALRDGLPPVVPQAGEPVYAEKLTSEDRHVVWGEPSEVTRRRVRIGGAWTELDGARVRIGSLRATDVASSRMPGEGAVVGTRLMVATADFDVEVVALQPEGKKMMSASDWVNGRRGVPIRFES
ncbi:MAG: hypothetical protein RLZZ39_242 [Actinomycetota bacterium]